MDDIDEELILSHELKKLADETLKNHKRLELADDKARARMAAAQVVQCHAMMEYFVDTEYDWRHFREKMVEVLELQRNWYREGREEGDRDKARIALSRVRIMKTLLRRLGDQCRREAILATLQPNVVWN